ncbi:class I histocompatibility antigen, Gogo-A*0501 alpha chain-like [Hoplias malabaricus]|uniref:class I histocompatibility antigen, Gogo-A*0501 alpha chain-like n=1 Tax=Hoplias malabaricus TaxID=27720 RepID=UPI003461907D
MEFLLIIAWLVLCIHYVDTQAKHSLFYLFTVQSRRSVNNIYESSVVTFLNDTQIDSYNSWSNVRIPKQTWMKELEERYWEGGTEKLKADINLTSSFLKIVMEDFGHNESELHVLQWRNGCEVEKHSDSAGFISNCFNGHGYDGEDLVSDTFKPMKWSTSEHEAKKREGRLNVEYYRETVQKCEECGTWLKIYLHFNTTETSVGM